MLLRDDNGQLLLLHALFLAVLEMTCYGASNDGDRKAQLGLSEALS